MGRNWIPMFALSASRCHLWKTVQPFLRSALIDQKARSETADNRRVVIPNSIPGICQAFSAFRPFPQPLNGLPERARSSSCMG